MSSKCIYLRVSKKDLDEEKQLIEIQKKYNIQDPLIIREKMSAYKEEVQEKRLEFQNLKQLIREGQITEVYVFSIERLERNITRLFEFFFFCEAHECPIYSVMQDIPNKKQGETPMITFLRYINLLLFGYKGQEESYTTSYRTQSAVKKNKNNTFSYKGNKWGKKFRNLQGEKINIDEQTLNTLQKDILDKCNQFESQGRKHYYVDIISYIAKKHKLKISKAYITLLRNNNDDRH